MRCVYLKAFLVIGFCAFLVTFAGCMKRDSAASHEESGPAATLFWRAESQYLTNDSQTAYDATLSARNELIKMRQMKTAGRSVDWPFCLAVLNSRLFVMARSLAKTNEKELYFAESIYHWNQVREESNESPTNYSREDIVARVGRLDEAARKRRDAAGKVDGTK